VKCYASDVIKIALNEVGYLEKKSNKNLDSKTANAGDKNYTKYARDLDKISGFYNGIKQGQQWCDMFVDWCFVQAFGVESAKKLLCHGKSGAGCYYSMNYYKKQGRLYFSPVVGDQIFFKNPNGSITHTGLVTKVDNEFVYTVEGNTSTGEGVIPNGGGVCEKKYNLSDECIVGYGRPAYDVPEKNEEKETKKMCTIKVPVLRKGDKGDSVKALQTLLIGKGYDCGKFGADGDFGNGTEKALKALQADEKLTVDGIAGAKSWSALTN
jgi:hypothetical protein